MDRFYVEYLNKDINFQVDRKYFDTYSGALRWAKKEFESFHPDMVRIAAVL